MSRVTFQFTNGQTRTMHELAAAVLAKRGLGVYMTRDMVAAKIEVDSEGHPWDPEQHVASKLQNKDGTWRKKPGAAKQDGDE